MAYHHVSLLADTLPERQVAPRSLPDVYRLILDTRRGWMEKDLDLKRWLEHHGRPYLVVATKTDKLNQSELEHGLRAIRKEGVEPMPFSALTHSWLSVKRSSAIYPSLFRLYRCGTKGSGVPR